MQMSPSRLALLTVATGALVFGIFLLWLHSPAPLAIFGGAAFGAVFLLVAASLGDDPIAADEAWRADAGDLKGQAADPGATGAGVTGGGSTGAASSPGSVRPDELLVAAGPAATTRDGGDKALDDGSTGV